MPGLTLSIELFFPTHFVAPRVKTAAEAISTVVERSCSKIAKVGAIELIKGEDGTDPLQDVWHVSVEEETKKVGETAHNDYFIESDGTIVLMSGKSCLRSLR